MSYWPQKLQCTRQLWLKEAKTPPIHLENDGRDHLKFGSKLTWMYQPLSIRELVNVVGLFETRKEFSRRHLWGLVEALVAHAAFELAL